ncbi:ATP-grasp domain-containing protein [Pseudomonas monteilii]|uniref:ATP-grasp domain-containing protein n=1 Tax=Pseudomonas monteilii TaxID=76759 RepID=A0A399MCT1_9PSED|nr:ATP-grasp domain-containing protein [Pseudomonas monteilii]RII79660.1 ATP-grasp domain-containing protein [Pseudomonas monteilii]
MSNARVACIVDGHSTGAELAKALKELGWFLVHVQARERISSSYVKSFESAIFDVLLRASEVNYSDLVQMVREYNPEFVIAGSEPGVELADLLSSSLGLKGNDPESSPRRRNKYLMAKAIAEHGLDCAKQYMVSTEPELLDGLRRINTLPVVVKPVDAMGSEDVRVCFDEHEALDAFGAILGKKNVVGVVNEAVLVQEFLDGEQYVVNAVSIEGKHRVTEMWREKRLNVRGGGNIYDYETMIPYEGKIQEKLISYTKKVLTALGIEEGPSHTEIIFTARGPVLVETGARMQGGIISEPIIKAIGDSHMTMTLKKYLDPLWFVRNIDAPYHMTKISRVVNLIMGRAGVVKENNCIKLLTTLPSFYMIARTPSVGDYVKETVDLPSKVGHIYLMHEDLSQLETDYRKIREWEASGDLIILS